MPEVEQNLAVWKDWGWSGQGGVVFPNPLLHTSTIFVYMSGAPICSEE